LASDINEKWMKLKDKLKETADEIINKKEFNIEK
jgi:hypothetical protein